LFNIFAGHLSFPFFELILKINVWRSTAVTIGRSLGLRLTFSSSDARPGVGEFFNFFRRHRFIWNFVLLLRTKVIISFETMRRWLQVVVSGAFGCLLFHPQPPKYFAFRSTMKFCFLFVSRPMSYLAIYLRWWKMMLTRNGVVLRGVFPQTQRLFFVDGAQRVGSSQGGRNTTVHGCCQYFEAFFVPLKNHQSDESTFLDTEPLALSLLFSGPMFFL
jgi:hypothetical protein